MTRFNNVQHDDIAVSLILLSIFMFPVVIQAQIWNTRAFEGGDNIEIIHDSLQVDRLGRIHIAYVRDDTLIYSRFDGTEWIREILAAGIDSSWTTHDASFKFGLDHHDIPHVGYRAAMAYFHLFRDEEGWKVSDKEYGLYDVAGNYHSTFRLWDDWLGCDTIYHHGPTGTTQLGLCYWEEDRCVDYIDLRLDRYPTVVYIDCDGCSVNLSWCSDEGIWQNDKLDSTYYQYCMAECLYLGHDPLGDAHVLYSRDAMCYVRWSPEEGSRSTCIDGADWFISNIAVDTSGNAHIGHRGIDALRYARISDGILHTETIDSGGNWRNTLSNGILPDLTPLVLAYDEANDELLLWSRINEVWTPQVLDRLTTDILDFAIATDSVFRNAAIYLDANSRSLKFVREVDDIERVETIREFSGNTFGLCALAYDRQDNLHMACYLFGTNEIIYGLKIANAAWQTESFSAPENIHAMDLAIDTEGNPAICYQNGNLSIAKKVAGEWEIKVLDDSGTINGDLSIGITNDASMNILCFRTTGIGTDIIFISQEGLEWRREIIHSFDGPAGTCDLVIDASEQPHAVVTYSSDDARQDEVWSVEILKRSNSVWSRTTVGTGRGFTDAALVLDGTSSVWIVCQDRGMGCVCYRLYENRWLPTLIAGPHEGLPGVAVTLCDPDQISMMYRSRSGLIGVSQELPEIGVRLDMPSWKYSQGDPCYLYAYLSNWASMPLHANLFILLQYGDTLWFYPSWSTDFSTNTEGCFVPVDVPSGIIFKEIIPWFDWPETLINRDGFVFYGALVDIGLTRILGDLDGLGIWAFSI